MYLRHPQQLLVHAPIESNCRYPLTIPVPAAPELQLYVLDGFSHRRRTLLRDIQPVCRLSCVVARKCRRRAATWAARQILATLPIHSKHDARTSSLLVKRLRSSRSAKLSNMSTTAFGLAGSAPADATCVRCARTLSQCTEYHCTRSAQSLFALRT